MREYDCRFGMKRKQLALAHLTPRSKLARTGILALVTDFSGMDAAAYALREMLPQQATEADPVRTGIPCCIFTRMCERDLSRHVAPWTFTLLSHRAHNGADKATMRDQGTRMAEKRYGGNQ